MDIEIDSSIGENDRLLYSYAQVKGTRSSDPIEDTFAIKPDINHMASFFGVYDGHGGKCTYISAFARDHLHEYVFQNPVFHQRCLTDAFYKIDEQLETAKAKICGSTAVTAVIMPDRFFVASAGDSRAILSVRGQAIEMSQDHKPECEFPKAEKGSPYQEPEGKEAKRIFKAGGSVSFRGCLRVGGCLAMTRALGDFALKDRPDLPRNEQKIIPEPDITDHKIEDDTEFLVLASDGIWDIMDSQAVVSFIRVADRRGTSFDDMTVIIIGFKHGRSSDNWYEWISEDVPYAIEEDSLTTSCRSKRKLRDAIPDHDNESENQIEGPSTRSKYNKKSRVNLQNTSLADMAAAGDLQIQVSALQKQIKILKNDKHQARLSCLDLLGASIDNLETVQEIQAKIRSLQEEKEQLQNRLEVQQQQFEAREQETIVDLAKWAAEQEKHLLLHEAFEKGNDSLVTLEAKYQSLLEENTRLKIEIEKKDCIITNLQGQITGLQATVTANSKDINDLKFQVTQLTQLIQTVKIDNQR